MTISNLAAELKTYKLEDIAPKFKKGVLSEEDVNKVIEKIAKDIDTTKSLALAGTMLLMLKGAASGGTPQTLSVELQDGKILAKRNVVAAYLSVTSNTYIRRLAESLAVEIGEFAQAHNLPGELAQRINTAIKAESGEILTMNEMAWCSSFSQNIPDLAYRSSDRVVKLLAEDYKKRFDNKKKQTVKENLTNSKNKRGK